MNGSNLNILHWVIFLLRDRKKTKKGLFKRLKNIEDKSEEQLKIIGNKTGIKSQTDLFDEELTLVAIALIEEIKSIEDSVDYDKLSFMGGNKNLRS